MNNREWTLIIAKEFDVSMKTARQMLHAMFEVKRMKDLSNSYNISSKEDIIKGINSKEHNDFQEGYDKAIHDAIKLLGVVKDGKENQAVDH